MITLQDLRTAMAASGRPLTKRAARDWWSKGLLPRPRRKGLGQGRGTETYWLDCRVAAQAEAVYDFLGMHSRTYSAAVHLWLSGFPVELALVRSGYRRMIGRHSRFPHATDDPDGRIGALAAQMSRHLIKTDRLPRAIQDDLTDLTLPFLEIFFGNRVFDGEGLSELWGRVEPYLWDTKVSGALALNDHQLEIAAKYLSRMGSLTAQRDAIRSASDYELTRARRLLLFVFGSVRRMVNLIDQADTLDVSCRNCSIAMSRLAVPILVMVLRENSLRHCITGFLLEASSKLRTGIQSGNFPYVAGAETEGLTFSTKGPLDK